MHLTRIIGIGSPHGGDSIGWKLTEHLPRHFYGRFPGRFPAGLEWKTCTHPATELIHLFHSVETVVLIDALQSPLPPGQAQLIQPEDLLRHPQSSSHGLGVSETLALAKALDMLPPRLLIIGVSMGRTEPDPSLISTASDQVKAILDTLLHPV